MVVSSSLVISSKVKPYWKPEQPPPCTKTRSFSSGLPSSAIRSATLAAALSVKTMGSGIIAGTSARAADGTFSATALMKEDSCEGAEGSANESDATASDKKPPEGGSLTVRAV